MKISRTHTQLNNSRRCASDGFTLVELMAVVAIVGILAVAAMGLFDVSTRKARIQACDNNIKTITIAINRAATIYELPKSQINDEQVDQYIPGGLASLSCNASKNPEPTYHVVKGVITPAHDHR